MRTLIIYTLGLNSYCVQQICSPIRLSLQKVLVPCAGSIPVLMIRDSRADLLCAVKTEPNGAGNQYWFIIMMGRFSKCSGTIMHREWGKLYAK